MSDKWIKPSVIDAEEMKKAVEDERQRLHDIAEERRHAERVALKAKVSITSETNFFTGWSQNISEGGIFISSLAPPTVGTVVDVNLDMGTDGETITLSCKVVWIRTEAGQPVGCGCQFVGLSDIQAARIKSVMQGANREPLFYDV
jgi:uncharacterized protein (TIGR02266 family)